MRVHYTCHDIEILLYLGKNTKTCHWLFGKGKKNVSSLSQVIADFCFSAIKINSWLCKDQRCTHTLKKKCLEASNCQSVLSLLVSNVLSGPCTFHQSRNLLRCFFFLADKPVDTSHCPCAASSSSINLRYCAKPPSMLRTVRLLHTHSSWHTIWMSRSSWDTNTTPP